MHGLQNWSLICASGLFFSCGYAYPVGYGVTMVLSCSSCYLYRSTRYLTQFQVNWVNNTHSSQRLGEQTRKIPEVLHRSKYHIIKRVFVRVNLNTVSSVAARAGERPASAFIDRGIVKKGVGVFMWKKQNFNMVASQQ